MSTKLAISDVDKLAFDPKTGLIPCIVQDARTLDVLMLGYMNEQSYIESFNLGKLTFWSRSRNEIWTKGLTSGNYLIIDSLYLDCDNDSILALVNPEGPTCHTGETSCFGITHDKVMFLKTLEDVIGDRIANPIKGSYTNKLVQKGINKVIQKFGEEAVELIIEAKDNDKNLFVNEAADMFYHLTVLLAMKGYTYQDIMKVLKTRHEIT